MDTITFASSIAKQTGELLLDYYQLSGIHFEYKTDNTVVTKADLAADSLIHKSIQDRFPDDGLLSEEKDTTYALGKRRVWVVDPLDGTTNFSLGLHYWGVSIALIEDGWPVVAALYFPILDELYTAQLGEGAFINGNPLEINKTGKSNQISFFSCCSRALRRYKINVRHKTRILGSAAYGLISVAKGSAILSFEVTPKIWDFAGSWLVVREAGGIIETLDGPDHFPLIAGIDYGNKSYPTLAAATREVADYGKQNIHPRVSER